MLKKPRAAAHLGFELFRMVFEDRLEQSSQSCEGRIDFIDERSGIFEELAYGVS